MPIVDEMIDARIAALEAQLAETRKALEEAATALEAQTAELAVVQAERDAAREYAMQARLREARLRENAAKNARVSAVSRASRTEAALEATPAPMVNRPTHCGGCGETEPAKRCIGCLADFGPASLHQQETADEIADETVETAAPMFQFRIGDGELVFEIPGSIIVSVEPDGAGYAFFDHETNQWVSGEHLIAEDIEAAGMEIAKALAGTCDAYDKGHDDAMAGAAVHAIREMLNEIGVPQAAFIDDHVRNGLVWARRQALEEAAQVADDEAEIERSLTRREAAQSADYIAQRIRELKEGSASR